MEANTVTLIIGLSGIGATLIASGLGIYFTAKARSSSLREALFKKQLNIITRIMHRQGRFRVFATILSEENGTYKIQAREDIGDCTKDFSEIQEKGAAILPTELWVEVKRLNDHMTKVLVVYDEGKGISEGSYKTLVAMMAKIGLLARTVIGTDELTEEGLRIFSSKENYENLANMEIEHFTKMHEEANA
ncbi:MAG: hypothetical protein KAI50_13305 [Desulfobacterales bacterium]|nr:hypothetical protein [Desulfobacterales bacterium]